jgi:hypothetical protein
MTGVSLGADGGPTRPEVIRLRRNCATRAVVSEVAVPIEDSLFVIRRDYHMSLGMDTKPPIKMHHVPYPPNFPADTETPRSSSSSCPP